MTPGDLPMPSDLRTPSKSGAASALPPPAIEPPSAKLIVRLFLIPLLIAAGVIAIMLPISLLAGREPTLEEAIERLKRPGGERTFGLVGPGSKQRWMDAKVLVDQMKMGLNESQRIKLAGDLIEILQQHTNPGEGEVQQFILLALGRVWQPVPGQAPMNSEPALASRQKAVQALIQFIDSPSIPARKAALSAISFLEGTPEAEQAVPMIIRRLADETEDVDVRIVAAMALGNISSAKDQQVVDALLAAMDDADPRNAELVWNAAMSLAKFDRPEASGTMLKLLSRDELANIKVFDRQTDPKNPVFRTLSEAEQQRFLINAMQRARHMSDPAVQDRLKEVTEKDPSQRVRAFGLELLAEKR
jgi:hypothetical protein